MVFIEKSTVSFLKKMNISNIAPLCVSNGGFIFIARQFYPMAVVDEVVVDNIFKEVKGG